MTIFEDLRLRAKATAKDLTFEAKAKAKDQRWSPRGRLWSRGRPRGHIFKSLALKPQVHENCRVLSSGTALFFELLKACEAPKTCWKTIFSGDRLKHFSEDLFLGGG